MKTAMSTPVQTGANLKKLGRNTWGIRDKEGVLHLTIKGPWRAVRGGDIKKGTRGGGGGARHLVKRFKGSPGGRKNPYERGVWKPGAKLEVGKTTQTQIESEGENGGRTTKPDEG